MNGQRKGYAFLSGAFSGVSGKETKNFGRGGASVKESVKNQNSFLSNIAENLFLILIFTAPFMGKD